MFADFISRIELRVDQGITWLERKAGKFEEYPFWIQVTFVGFMFFILSIPEILSTAYLKTKEYLIKMVKFLLKNCVWRFRRKATECIEIKTNFLREIDIYNDKLSDEQKKTVRAYCEETFPEMFTSNFFLNRYEPTDKIPEKVMNYLTENVGREYIDWAVTNHIKFNEEEDDYQYLVKVTLRKGFEDHLTMMRMFMSKDELEHNKS